VKGVQRTPIHKSVQLRQALAVSEERLRSTLAELEAARSQAREASANRDKALAMLIHELRVPLTPMLVMTGLLEQDSTLSPAQREAAITIRRNAELEARLIEDLFELTRIASGKLALAFAETDAEGELREVLEGCERQIREKRLAVVLRLLAADHRVYADPARLHQILWNLLHNAIKFTPAEGQITVRSANTSGQLLLEVADTGIGIEPDMLSRIFDIFEQGSSEVTRRFGGLGVGLAVSKGLAEAHGGTLTASSAGPGKGSVFTLELPLTAACKRLSS
jgi:signal transduction histidine kinase